MYFKKIQILFLFSIIFLLNITSLSFSQTIQAGVEVKIKETITLEIREKLTDFQEIISDYINNNDWTNDEVDVEISSKKTDKEQGSIIKIKPGEKTEFPLRHTRQPITSRAWDTTRPPPSR